MTDNTSSCLFCEKKKSNPNSFKEYLWITNFCIEYLGHKTWFTICPNCRDKTFNEAMKILAKKVMNK